MGDSVERRLAALRSGTVPARWRWMALLAAMGVIVFVVGLVTIGSTDLRRVSSPFWLLVVGAVMIVAGGFGSVSTLVRGAQDRRTISAIRRVASPALFVPVTGRFPGRAATVSGSGATMYTADGAGIRGWRPDGSCVSTTPWRDISGFAVGHIPYSRGVLAIVEMHRSDGTVSLGLRAAMASPDQPTEAWVQAVVDELRAVALARGAHVGRTPAG